MDPDLSKKISIIDSAKKRTKKQKWPCFFPQCHKQAIRSHAQTRSSSLRNIQENGHIIERGFDYFQFKPMPDWKRTGIKRAATFLGFCKSHNDKLFKQVDSIGDRSLNHKVLFALAFRTFSLEMRKKEYQADETKRILLRAKNIFDKDAFDYLNGFRAGMHNCLKITKPHYLKIFEATLFAHDDAQSMLHRIYKSEKNLGISCSTCINPIPIHKQPLDVPQPFIFFNVLPRRNYTLIILSSFEQDIQKMDNFISIYYRLEDLIFNFCEEVTMRISFFESLDRNLLSIIDEAQAPWPNWQPIKVPHLFNFSLGKDSLWCTV
jgi:hypothetical protein